MDDETLELLITPRDWLRYAVSRFRESGLAFGHGTDNAYDEAAYLVLHALHLPPDRLEPFLDARLTRGERLQLRDILQRRIETRLPAPYLTNEAWLGEFRFHVDPRVIIPRSYFAELLEDGLAPWVADPLDIADALDLCTGSACLAILMAHVFPRAAIDAVDISADALDVARRNVSDYGLEGRIRLVTSDLFAGLGRRRYDLILSNPPYVTEAAMQALPPEYRHEPALALAAGEDGLDVVRRILAQAGAHLAAGGLLCVEVGHGRDAVEEAFPETEFTWMASRSGSDAVFLLQREQLP